MYELNIPPIPYSDPWNIHYDVRNMQLLSKQTRVAYFYSTPNNSTFRYRAMNMVECLTYGTEDVSCAWFCNDDYEHMTRVLNQIEVLVLCRVKFCDKINHLLTLARKLKVRVYYDVDDLVIDAHYTQLLMETLDQPLTEVDLNFRFGDMVRHQMVVERCDAVITTNPYLAGLIKKSSGLPTHIIPNFFNRRQQQESEKIWQRKLDIGLKRDGRVHIGYFSGSPSHNRDFRLVSRALAEILREYPQTVLRIVGFLELDDHFQDLEEQVEFLPLQDYWNLQRLIGEVEINIAPLLNNTFTNCKSELKYFEAAIVGTLTAATPIYTMEHSIIHNETGWLVKEYEWDGVLRNLIGMVEQGNYMDTLEKAHDQVVERYDWLKYAESITQVLGLNSAAKDSAVSVC